MPSRPTPSGPQDRGGALAPSWRWCAPQVLAVLSVLMVAGLLAGSGRGSAQAVETPAPGKRVLFVGWVGEFLDVDLADLKVTARWSLPQIDGFAAQMPPWVPGRARRAEGVWAPGGILYDPAGSRFFGVFPLAAETGSAVEGAGYRVLSFRLAPAEVLAHRDLPEAQGAPRLLLAPGGEHLLLSYASTETEPAAPVVEIADAASLAKVEILKRAVDRRAAESPGGGRTFLPALSRWAHAGPGGRIYDGLNEITLRPGELVVERVVPVDAMTPEQRRALSGYESVDPVSGKPWLKYAPVGSQAGRTLLTVASEPPGRSALFTLDLAAARVLSVVEVGPSTADSVLLFAGGTRLLVQELNLREGSGSSGESFATGRFLIYDVETGELLRELVRPELAGPDARVLCLTGDGERCFVAVGGALYVLDLWRDQPLRILGSDFDPTRWTICVFHDA